MNRNRMIRRLELSIKRLDKKIERLKIKTIRRLRQSHMDIKNAIIHGYCNNEVMTDYNTLFRVDQETGECVDYLIYFPDYDKIAKIKRYLEAYLITNRDVLEDEKIGELEGLLRYFS